MNGAAALTDQRCQCSRGGYRGSPIRIAGAERSGFGQKALSRCCIAFGREKEVDRRTSEMRRRKKATKIDG